MKGYETISHAAVDFGQGETGAVTHTIDERINHQISINPLVLDPDLSEQCCLLTFELRQHP